MVRELGEVPQAVGAVVAVVALNHVQTGRQFTAQHQMSPSNLRPQLVPSRSPAAARAAAAAEAGDAAAAGAEARARILVLPEVLAPAWQSSLAAHQPLPPRPRLPARRQPWRAPVHRRRRVFPQISASLLSTAPNRTNLFSAKRCCARALHVPLADLRLRGAPRLPNCTHLCSSCPLQAKPAARATQAAAGKDGLPARPPTGWWRRLPEDDCDPITLDPLRELANPPFELTAESGVTYRFDGKVLAEYLVVSAPS